MSCLYGRLPTRAEVRKYTGRRPDGYRVKIYLYAVFDPRQTKADSLSRVDEYCLRLDWGLGTRQTLRRAVIDLYSDKCREDNIRSDMLELTIRDLFAISPMKMADLLKALRQVFPDLTSKEVKRKLEKLELVGVINRKR